MARHQHEAPQAPAEAYELMAEHLGEEYFTRPTPVAGQLLVVMGRDGCETRWHLTNLEASRTADWIHDQPGLACLRRIRYDPRGVTP